MKWSFATIGVFLIGFIGVIIILLFQEVTTSNENDYYLLKEITEAAMIDAIDIPYYRETGDLKIVREKFVENFTRRFSESTIFVTNSYTIKSYDIMETPPKVSIIIDTGIGEYTIGGNTDDYGLKNKLDGILEYVGDKTFVSSGSSYYGNPYVRRTYSNEYYAVVSKGAGSSSFNVTYSLKVPGVLVAPNIDNLEITNLQYVSGAVNSQGELGIALMKNELSYNNVTTDYTKTIKDYAYNVSGVSSDFYNCGISTGSYTCDDNNKYFVSLNGNVSDSSKVNVVFKYKVTWSYDEYEFAN